MVRITMRSDASEGYAARPEHVEEALGRSEEFLDFQERLSRVARVDRPVLIIGERGTGKELAARRLHYLSARWEQPLVALNCAALSPALIESELFGYEAGAFTGAVGRRAGRFESADGGTLFLDEIANIPVEVQEKILRVVEYGTFERVGSAANVQVDVRIIGATNADLAALATDGRFKRDLLDRLSFEVLFLPPLRERRGDIMLLANHFAARMAHELGWPGVPEFSEDASAALETHTWPGNVRELKNVVERAVYRSDSEVIRQIQFDPFTSPFAPPAPAGPTPYSRAEPSPAAPARAEAGLPPEEVALPDAVRDLEVRMLRRALEQSRHNQRRAAERLGLTYHQFRGLYRKHRPLADG
jgi:psp operon transcriptional activator